MSFRDLADEVDAAVFDGVGDEITIDGAPVSGMFYAPWLAPALGNKRTSVTEPHITVRDQVAATMSRDSVVGFAGKLFDVIKLEPDGTGITVVILRPKA